MNTFKYTARSVTGAESEGVVEANTRDEAASKIIGEGLVVSSIEQISGDGQINISLGRHKTKEKKLSLVCRQFAIILQAGLPIVRTVQLVAEQTDDANLKRTLSAAADDIAAGGGFAESLSRHGSGLPATFIETVRAGETSGSLDVIFERLADYYEARSKAKSKVTSSMVYPLFVLGVAVIVVAVIMIWAVPTFSNTLSAMGSEMPFVTMALIAMSDFMVNYSLVIVAVVVIVVIALRLARRNDAFHRAWSRLGLKLPVMGRINRMNACGQYASTMATMLAAGLPVARSVDVASRSITNFDMAESLQGILPDLEAGKRLSSSMESTGAWPDLICEMTGVGEETGSLEETLDIVSDYYDNEVEQATTRAMAILEPVMIIILAVIVLFILLAVYLPMFSLYAAF